MNVTSVLKNQFDENQGNKRRNIMLWNEIITQEDVKNFNEIIGNFHDSCLKEMCFSSGGYVSTDLKMDVLSNPIARFLFQRQSKNPSSIEVEFSNIIQINIKPVPENDGVDIINTHLYLEDKIFFWSEKDYQFWEEGKEKCTWIASKVVKWRERDDLLGEENVYMTD